MFTLVTLIASLVCVALCFAEEEDWDYSLLLFLGSLCFGAMSVASLFWG